MVTTTTENYVQLTAGKVRYLEAGSGDPLLMIHGMGFSNSANSFDPILDEMAKHFHCYALDMLGFGLGDRELVDAPTFDTIIDTFREFMDHIGIEKAHYIGHSAGGWMGAIFAYESPERIDKLVMLCSAGMNVEPSAGIGNAPAVPTLEQMKERTAGQFLDKSKATGPIVDHMAKAQKTAADQPNALASLNPLLHQMATPEIRNRYLLQRRLPHIKAQTLVIWGEGDTMDPYPTWTQEYALLGGDMSKSVKPWIIPGAKYVLLPTGHSPHWEQPAETVQLLLDFLQN